jgi:hypothetical protein
MSCSGEIKYNSGDPTTFVQFRIQNEPAGAWKDLGNEASLTKFVDALIHMRDMKTLF